MKQFKVGLVGLGNMGGGAGATLVRNGYPVIGYDRDSARVESLAAEGGAAAASVEELASGADVIFVSLPSSQVTVDVIENQIAPAARPGSVVIDLGTTLVRETRRLHGVLEHRGVALLDAPVSGGPAGAAAGRLYVFVGGRREAAERHWDMLAVLGGARLTYCGESGTGQIAKAVNQLAMGLVDAAFIEAVAFGVAGGVDAAVLRDAIGADSGFRAQFKTIAGRIADGRGDAMDVKYAELGYFVDAAEAHGYAAPMLRALHTFMKAFPESERDNMGRPYPPLYSALTGLRTPE